jgi:hypothetical protein
MSDNIESRLSPAEEDPQLHALLAALPHHPPSSGFADRVMAEVWRPAPLWARQMRRAGRAIFNAKRAWVLAGGLAASSTIMAVLITAAVAANWVRVQAAWTVFTGGFLLDFWRLTVQTAARTVMWLNAAAAPFSANSALVTVMIVGGALTVLGSAWGLRRTIRQYNTERVTLHAGH